MSKQTTIQEITAAILAILTVIGAFLIVLYDTVNDKPVSVPQWVTLMIGGVIASYFTHAAAVNGARKAGIAAAQSAYDRSANATGGTTNAGNATGNPGSNG